MRASARGPLLASALSALLCALSAGLHAQAQDIPLWEVPPDTAAAATVATGSARSAGLVGRPGPTASRAMRPFGRRRASRSRSEAHSTNSIA